MVCICISLTNKSITHRLLVHDDKMWLLANEEASTQALTVSEDVDEQTFEDEDVNIGDEQTYEDEDRNIGDDYIPQEVSTLFVKCIKCIC